MQTLIESIPLPVLHYFISFTLCIPTICAIIAAFGIFWAISTFNAMRKGRDTTVSASVMLIALIIESIVITTMVYSWVFINAN